MNKYEVTEWCPHCESEITMTWDVESMGYKAFCPVCGERLMLCDMCQRHLPFQSWVNAKREGYATG